MDACSITADLFGDIVANYLKSKDRAIMKFVCKLFAYLPVIRNQIGISARAYELGRLPLIKWCYDMNYPVLESSSARVIISANMETIEWLFARDLLRDWNIIANIILAQRIDILELICGKYHSVDALNYLAKCGRGDLAKKYATDVSDIALVGAINSNNYEYVESVINRRDNRYIAIYCIECKTNNIQILNLLNKCGFLDEIIATNSAGNDLNAYNWCVDNNIALGNVCKVASSANLEVFKVCARDNFDAYICSSKNRDVILYCYENNLITVNTPHIANCIGEIGSIAFLQWYINSGGKWDTLIYDNAVIHNNGGFIEYCDEQKYPIGAFVWEYAMEHSFEMFLKYYDKNQIFSVSELCKFDTKKVIDLFVERGRSNYCDVSNLMIGAIKYENTEILYFIVILSRKLGTEQAFIDNLRCSLHERANVKVMRWYINCGFSLEGLAGDIINLNDYKLLRLIPAGEHDARILYPLDDININYAKNRGWNLSFCGDYNKCANMSKYVRKQ
jgi:hypothetical protein